MENREKGELFVSMPRYKSNDRDENGETVYKDVCNPITKEFREKLYGAVLDTYKKEKEKSQSELANRMKNQEQDKTESAPVQETPFR